MSNGAGSEVDRDLVGRPLRRWASPEYRLRILREADACSTPGEVGALLRREGLYMSQLTYWRTRKEAAALEVLDERRGRASTDDIAELRQRLERAETELEKARKVIAMQRNLSALLEHLLGPDGASEVASTGR